MFVRLLFMLPMFMLAAHAHADIYECVDANGGKQFTNVPPNPKACRLLSITPSSGPSPPAPAAPRSAAKPQVATTPSQFPRVDREMQRSRDNDRLRILENELGAEERLLAQAKKELSDQEGVRLGSETNYQRVLERLEPFQKRVRLHEDNIANLRKEISKVR